jgi:hypothetical protein
MSIRVECFVVAEVAIRDSTKQVQRAREALRLSGKGPPRKAQRKPS